MIKAKQEEICVFVIKKINGILTFLFKARWNVAIVLKVFCLSNNLEGNYKQVL